MLQIVINSNDGRKVERKLLRGDFPADAIIRAENEADKQERFPRGGEHKAMHDAGRKICSDSLLCEKSCELECCGLVTGCRPQHMNPSIWCKKPRSDSISGSTMA